MCMFIQKVLHNAPDKGVTQNKEVQLMYVTSDIIERNHNGWEQNQELTAQF